MKQAAWWDPDPEERRKPRPWWREQVAIATVLVLISFAVFAIGFELLTPNATRVEGTAAGVTRYCVKPTAAVRYPHIKHSRWACDQSQVGRKVHYPTYTPASTGG